jgi:hypothetical protein
MSCYIVVAQGEHDFSEGACPCGTEPPELGGKMAAERHVGAPECVNETCACGDLPLTPHIEAVAQRPRAGDGPWDNPNSLAHEVKERRERIATAVLAGLAAGRDYDEIVDYAKSLHGKAAPMAVAWADALIVELDKVEK